MKTLYLFMLIPVMMLTACGDKDDNGNGNGNGNDNWIDGGEVKAYAITLNSDGNGTATATVREEEVTSATKGTSVVLTAKPNAGYLLDKWSTENHKVTFADAETSPTTFVMPLGDVVIEVSFIEDAGFDIFTEITDPEFKAYCERFDTDYNGILSFDEAYAVKEIIVNGLNITSLNGIEYFKNLEDLECSNNQLTSLDMSGCTTLKWVYCAYNQLTSLDVSGCTALSAIACLNNQLISLNASGCVELAILVYYYGLKELDVSGCTGLKTLYCDVNQLTKLDVSGCTGLEELYCSNNQLTSLDISECTALYSLYCDNNRMAELDISNMTVNSYGNYYVYCGAQTTDGTTPLTLSLTLREDQKSLWNDYLTWDYDNANVVLAN